MRRKFKINQQVFTILNMELCPAVINSYSDYGNEVSYGISVKTSKISKLGNPVHVFTSRYEMSLFKTKEELINAYKKILK